LSESEKSTGTAPRLSDLVFGRVSGAVGLDGLASTSPAFVFSLYFQRVGGPLVWVTGSNQAAEQLAEDLAFFLPEALRSQVLVFPGPEADPYRGLSPHPGLSARRAVALSRLSRGFRGILLAPVGALMSRTVSPYIFRKRCLALSLGTSIPRETLISKLRSMGYVREDPVAGIGEFSFRGGIVDMFSPSHEAPVRIEYFGDEIESIRQFEPSTQRSVGLIPECEIVPMRETTPTNEEISAWHARAPEFWNEVRYAGTLSEYLQFTDKGELFNGFEFLFPLVCPLEAGLIDYLEDSEDGAHFLLQEPEDLLSAIDVRWREAREAYEERSREGAPVLPPSGSTSSGPPSSVTWGDSRACVWRPCRPPPKRHGPSTFVLPGVTKGACGRCCPTSSAGEPMEPGWCLRSPARGWPIDCCRSFVSMRRPRAPPGMGFSRPLASLSRW
jgi:transcription-repair coupling factor (superfamily II helicase)